MEFHLEPVDLTPRCAKRRRLSRRMLKSAGGTIEVEGVGKGHGEPANADAGADEPAEQRVSSSSAGCETAYPGSN